MSAVRDQFESAGNQFFAWRSYLPGIYLAVLCCAMQDFSYLGGDHVYQELWSAGCLFLSLVGLIVRAVVVGCAPHGTSGRNTAGQLAEELNTTGLYSVVRHPLYLGNFLIWLGITSFCLLWWLSIIYALLFCVYYERIIFAEEEFLRRRFGQAFIDWAAQTPTFIPNWRRWRAPSLAFSWRNVLRREYTALMGIFAAFAALEFAEHLVVERRMLLQWHWATLSATAVFASLLLRFLKRRTALLRVVGR